MGGAIAEQQATRKAQAGTEHQAQARVDDWYGRLTATLTTAAREICEHRNPAVQLVATEEILRLRRERRQCQALLGAAQGDRVQRALVGARKALSREIAQAVQREKQRLSQRFARKLQAMDAPEQMRVVRSIIADQRTRLVNRLDPEQVDQYAAFYEGVYRSPWEPNQTETRPEIAAPAAATAGHSPRLSAQEAADICTAENVARAIRGAANGTAPGVSEVTAEMLKAGGQGTAQALQALFLAILMGGPVPVAWRTAVLVLVPVPKKGDATLIENNRPVSLTEVPRKVFEALLEAHIKRTMRPLCISQGGFREHRGCADQVATLQEVMLRRKGMLYAFLDIKAAYDTVDRRLLWAKCLAEFGLSAAAVGVLQRLFDANQSVVRVGGRASRSIRLERGLLQGSVLSPLLYSMFIDDMLAQVNRVHPTRIGRMPVSCLAYADDIVLFARTEEAMGRQLEVCAAYAEEHAFSFAPGKCEVVAGRPVRVALGGAALAQTESFKYLGVPVDHRGVRAKQHLQELAQKARDATMALRDIGMHGRGFGVATNARILKCFTRSRTEYCMAALPLLKTMLAGLDRTVAANMRIALSIPVKGYDRRVMRLLLDAEDSLVRHMSLRVRWLADAERKDASFIVHHALRWAPEDRNVRSAFHMRPAYAELKNMLHGQVRNELARLGVSEAGAGEQLLRRLWRRASIRWRNSRKQAEARTVRQRGLRQGAGRMLAWLQMHTEGGYVLARRIQAWLFGQLPAAAVACRRCGRQGSHMKHFVGHFDRARDLASAIARLTGRTRRLRSTRHAPEGAAAEMQAVTNLLDEFQQLWVAQRNWRPR